MLDQRVTLTDLEESDACEEACIEFAEVFPEGTTWRELLLTLAEHKNVIFWGNWVVSELSERYGAKLSVFHKERCESYDTYIGARRVIDQRLNDGAIAHDRYEQETRSLWDGHLATCRQALRDIANGTTAS